VDAGILAQGFCARENDMMQPRYIAGTIAVALLGLTAAGGDWVGARRPAPTELKADRTIVVFSSRDAGAGSLREAIFAAGSAVGRVRILIRPSRILLQSQLPPLVNPAGVVIDAESSRCRIDASQSGDGPVLDVASPFTVISGLGIEKAPAAAVTVRAAGVRLQDLSIANCGEGVRMADGSSDLLVERSRFQENGIGISVAGRAIRGMIRQNQFAKHDQAAVWAVADRAVKQEGFDIHLQGNEFQADRIGVVAINLPLRIERNDFQRARESAVFLAGQGSLVRANRIRDGASIGIFADQTEGAVLESNEIDHNAAVGLLLRSGNNAIVRRNRVYANGYGMAVVFGQPGSGNLLAENLVLGQIYDAFYVVGGSPFLRDNVALRNRQAAIRILDFEPRTGPIVVASPLLKGNRFESNLLNDIVRGVYRVRLEEDKQQEQQP
jgi:parallel beta-helix repeat protein